MTLHGLGNIGDLIGGIGVVISMSYLALQIRQNTNSVRGTAELESERKRMEWHRIGAENKDLAEFFEKAMATPGAMTWQERARFNWLLSAYF